VHGVVPIESIPRRRIRAQSAAALLLLAGCVGVVEDPPRPLRAVGGAASNPPGAGAPSFGGSPSLSGGTGTGPVSAGAGATATANGGVGSAPTACTSIASPGARVPLRRLTASQVERTVSDLLGVDLKLDVSDERLSTFRSNISSSVDVASARGYLDFANAAVAAADLTRCEKDCRAWLFDEAALRLFRHPLGDTERERYSALFDAGKTSGGAREGAAWVLEAMLQSPSFLYLDEVVEPDGSLDQGSVAARLSLALWDRNPDLALLHQAERGELATLTDAEETVTRLLSDPASEAGFGEFIDQWLDLGRLDDPDVRPDLTELGATTLAAMRSEPVQFFSALVRGGEAIDALLTSTQTAASALLEPIYGQDIVARSAGFFSLDPNHRGGVLSLPGVVAAVSHARRTSPTLRGKAVLSSFLCTPPSPPPAGLDITLPEVGSDVSTRERLEIHMTDPSCGSCHRGMDGIGFALEKLDWLGRFRKSENGRDIDDSSTFPLAGEQVTVAGAAELSKTLAAQPSVAQCLSKQWLRYAAGVSESNDQACLIERLTSDLRGARGLERMIVTTMTSDFIRRAGDAP
jgi:hypothetical protein